MRASPAVDVITPKFGLFSVAIGTASCTPAGARLEDQLRQLPAVQRQLQHLLVGDHLSDAGTACLDERRAPLNRHGFLNLTDLERDGERRVETIRSDRQVLQHVRPGVVGDSAAREARVDLHDGDCHVGQWQAGLILDGPVDLSGGHSLGPGSHVREEHNHDSVKRQPQSGSVHAGRASVTPSAYLRP